MRQVRFRLLEEQDTDCDQKITSQDQGSRRFRFKLHEQPYELTGSYVLSNLLQELTIALDSGSPPRLDRVMEDPIKRTSRLIRTQYWQQLSRSIDEDGLIRVLDDAKIAHQSQRTLYVPPDDNAALDYFEKVGLHYNSTYERLRHATSALPFVELLESPSPPPALIGMPANKRMASPKLTPPASACFCTSLH
jgi:alpha,alpha-trehalase